MNDISKGAISQTPKRIGILLADMGKFNRNVSVLKYLVLHMNTLQGAFTFEFLPADIDEDILQEDESLFLKNFIQKFSDRSTVAHARETEKGKELRDIEIPTFRRCYENYLQLSIKDFKIHDKEIPEYFILITTARFSNNFYSLREKGLAILALGDWDRHLAPPSIIEYILTLILRQSVAFVSPSLNGSIHLGTKGCLCDFTQSLSEVRQHVLNGFICSYCRACLKADRYASLADDLTPLLKRDWLGSFKEPHAQFV
ncbi:MAG TPA: hypothetical protein VFQ36_15455 [Ktedonobacteraceae bacterium]|nr:hypothetical protein [Ktedonobacteraceae bacterium]